MSRRTKLTPELTKQITDVLTGGATITDACAHVNISKDTFYRWFNTKSDFSDAVTHAQQQARLAAVIAIRQAIRGVDQTSNTEETLIETRLDKAGKPYEYKRVRKSHTVTQMAPDWRAAVEYLKRRDPEHWSEHVNLNVSVELVNKVIKAAEEAGVDASEVFNAIIAELAAVGANSETGN